MLTIGQGLYNLTARDASTLLLDPFFRVGSISLGAGVASGSATISVPQDRMLYIQTVTFALNASAGCFWDFIKLYALDSSGNIIQALQSYVADGTVGLSGDNTAAGAGRPVHINRDLNLLVPSGSAGVRFEASRSTPTNAATASCGITAFLVPPGGIGRYS